MPIVISALVFIFAGFFMAVSSVAGLLFIPVMIFMSTFFPREKTVAYNEEVSAQIIHIPLKRVPEQYYEGYALYLKSPEWYTLRKDVIKRDKYRCVDCGAMGKLQVHHLHYDGVETMTFTADQCISVCHDCHDIRHGKHLWK